MVINNLCVVQSQKYMKVNEKKKKESVEKLSSGYKLNKAADDASGLAISEDMRRQARGLNRASINSQEGISLVQIADGSMEEINEMLRRGLELCIESASGLLSNKDRDSLQDELERIKVEIDSISQRTFYSELNVLRGSGTDELKPITYKGKGLVYKGGLPEWVGGTVRQDNYMSGTSETEKEKKTKINQSAAFLDFAKFIGTQKQKNELIGNGFYMTSDNSNDYYSVKFTRKNENSVETSGNHFIYNVGIQNVSTAEELVSRIMEALDDGNPQGSSTKLAQDGKKLVAYDDQSKDASDTFPDAQLWKAADNSAFGAAADDSSVKFGEGIAYMDEDRIEMQVARGGQAISLQTCSGSGEMVPIDLPYVSCNKLGIADVNIGTKGPGAAGKQKPRLDEDGNPTGEYDTVYDGELDGDLSGALDGIERFRDALTYISEERSRCGAYQNRMEHNIENLEDTVRNLEDSESRMRDTDFILEQMKFSSSSVLAQAGQLILAQANQSYEGVINLLTF